MKPETFDFLSAEFRLILKKLTYARERLRYADREGAGDSILKHLSDAQAAVEEASAELRRLTGKPSPPSG